jgi:hypothetical protein
MDIQPDEVRGYPTEILIDFLAIAACAATIIALWYFAYRAWQKPQR